MQFEWDPAKSAANLVKHGIAFEDAQALWDGLVLPMDTKAGNDDHRDLAVGIINHKHWVAVTTPRGEKTRIISVRRARAHEQEAYDEYTQDSRRSDRRGNRQGV